MLSTREKKNFFSLGSISGAKQKFLECLILGILIFLGIQEPMGSNALLVDIEAESASDWKAANRVAYVGHSASFSQINGASLTIELPKDFVATSVEIQTYDFDKGSTSISLTSGGMPTVLFLPGDGLKDITLNAPVQSPLENVVSVTIGVEWENSLVLIDTIIFYGNADHRGTWILIFLGSLLLLLLLSRFVRGATPTTGKTYNSIDVFRAIAVSVVVFHHARGYSGLPDLEYNNLISRVARNGLHGVEIFYVLSAYTLTLSLMHSSAQKWRDRAFSFWIRRIIRILPSVIAIFLGISLVQGISGNFVGAKQLVVSVWRLFSMSYIFHDDAVRLILGHSVWWSIATEFQFYLAMPVLLSWVVRRKQSSIKNDLLSAFVVLSVGILMSWGSRVFLEDAPWLFRSLLYHSDAFAFGAAFRVATNQMKLPKYNRYLAYVLGVILFACFSLIVVYMNDLRVNLQLHEIHPERLLLFTATGLLLLFGRFVEEREPVSFDYPILCTIGKLSFIIYLLHIPMMELALWLGIPRFVATETGLYWYMIFFAFVGSSLAGLIIHRWIEVPVLQNSKTIMNWNRSREATFAYVSFVLVVSLFYAVAAFNGLNPDSFFSFL